MSNQIKKRLGQIIKDNKETADVDRTAHEVTAQALLIILKKVEKIEQLISYLYKNS